MSGGVTPGRFRLDALPNRRATYARYTEVLNTRAYDGTHFRCYSVEEYPLRGYIGPPARYSVVIDERDVFWIGAAHTLESSPLAESGAEQHAAPFARGVYRSRRNGRSLHEYDGGDCVVYAVEQRGSARGLLVASRCGIRFVGDESYWVVPAIDLDIGPLAGGRRK